MTRWMAVWLLLGLATGCSAPQSAAPSVESAAEIDPAPLPERKPAFSTHRAVAAPPPIHRERQVLWVALAAHLGADDASVPLVLQSAGPDPLLLRDASGAQWSGSSLQVGWQRLTLEQPLALARQVAGPFASFESAEQVARRWRALGVAAQVAHPRDWQVWAPVHAPVPEGVRVTSWSSQLVTASEPLLQTATGPVVLEGPLRIEAPGGLRWRGGVFQGPFRLQRDAYESWTLVEQVPVERYLAGVVPHEIGAGSPVAALQAQTVLARTWALANSHRFRIDGYHLCSDTQCQVYGDPRQAGWAVRQAIAATSGQLLSWDRLPISAVYHASNGGVMAAGPEAWSMDPQPYLKAQSDGDAGWTGRHGVPLTDRDAVAALLADGAGAYGQAHPRFRWTRSLRADDLRLALGVSGRELQDPLQLTVLERGASGRVLALQIAGASEATPVVLRLDQIRRTLRTLPSTLFVLESVGPQHWLVRGGGFGHGAGLSQAGAIDLARQGWPVERILSHYYPGAVYGPLPQSLESP